MITMSVADGRASIQNSATTETFDASLPELAMLTGYLSNPYGSISFGTHGINKVGGDLWLLGESASNGGIPLELMHLHALHQKATYALTSEDTGFLGGCGRLIAYRTDTAVEIQYYRPGERLSHTFEPADLGGLIRGLEAFDAPTDQRHLASIVHAARNFSNHARTQDCTDILGWGLTRTGPVPEGWVWPERARLVLDDALEELCNQLGVTREQVREHLG